MRCLNLLMLVTCPAHGFLKFGFRIDEEIGAGDDPLPFLQTIYNFKEVARLNSYFDFARLKVAGALVYNHHFTGPGIDNGTLRNREFSTKGNINPQRCINFDFFTFF